MNYRELPEPTGSAQRTHSSAVMRCISPFGPSDAAEFTACVCAGFDDLSWRHCVEYLWRENGTWIARSGHLGRFWTHCMCLPIMVVFIALTCIFGFDSRRFRWRSMALFALLSTCRSS